MDYSGTSTGANASIRAVRCPRGSPGRPRQIALVHDAFAFLHVTEGDGFYADGSFVQHHLAALLGTYGQVSGWTARLAVHPARRLEGGDGPGRRSSSTASSTLAPLVHDGPAADPVTAAPSAGRASERRPARQCSDHFHGQQIVAAAVLAAARATPSAGAATRGSRADPTRHRHPVLTAPQFGVADPARLYRDRHASVEAAPELPPHRLHGHGLQASTSPRLHRGLAMASDRFAHYECGNGENPRGWPLSSGYALSGGRTGPDPVGPTVYTDWFC
ncbi:hypothetical protein LV779_36995 [Streptomyces thinghirensis]|nr:hypothetical protein [Streptomyces thinghirensis]